MLRDFAGCSVDGIDDVVVTTGKPRRLPSALTLPMSGLPPPGMGQVVSTLRVAKSITETLPLPCGGPWILFDPRLAT